MGYLGIVNIDGTSHKIGSTLFGTCATEAATTAKVVTCSDFTELPTGVTIHVKFTYSNTAANPTLNINSKGAKSIYRYGTTVPGTTAETSWNAGAVVSFTYDGSSFMMNDWVNTNTNTDTNVTQTATNTNANYEVLFSGTADNTTRTESARKYSNLIFNPSTGTLTTTKVVASTSTLGVSDIDTANITEDNVGNLIVTGAARFLNTINGSISGNAATASDSAKLNGYASDTSATNNTIARRTANGYIFATYFNQSSGAETPTSSSYMIYANSDGYFRKSSIANMKTAMSLNNVENKSSATIRGEITSANVTTALGYTPVNKAGDTITGAIKIAGVDITLGTTGTSSDDSGDLVWSYGNNVEKMRLYAPNTPTAKFAPFFREFKSDGTSLYSGNLVLGDGTGASGTWGISITGNAATATSATKATQDSDGSAINSTYLKKSGGTMTGTLHVSNTGRIVWDYTAGQEGSFFTVNGADGYGIRYKEGTPDTMKFSASGNATTDAGADLCINGNGDGTVTIRGNTIAHAGNVGTGDSNGQVKIAGTNISVKGLGSAAYTASSAYAPANHSQSADTITSGYLNIQPENSPIIIPFIHNDLAFMITRGGSTSTTYDGTAQTIDLSGCFDGGPGYGYAISNSGDYTTIEMILNLHQSFGWTNAIYVDFGSVGWRAKDVQIDVMNSNFADDTWTTKYHNTNNGSGHCYVVMTHTPVGASNAGSGFNKIRFTFKTFNSSMFRITQFGVYNYSSGGVRTTYMSRGIDDAVWRSITPATTNTYSLGESNKKWANVYATTFNGDLSGNASTATLSSWTNLLKPIASQTSAGASTWNIPTGCYQVWGECFSDSRLKYTPSGGSETTVTDTGDWTMWLAGNGTSNTATFNMRIDGNYYGSTFVGNLSGNATTSTSTSNLTSNSRMDYGWNGVNYFNFSGTAGSGVKVNDTPTTAWWHIMRFNHGNNAGYYTDLAVPFNDTSLYYKRISNGALQNGGWVQVCDALNSGFVYTTTVKYYPHTRKFQVSKSTSAWDAQAYSQSGYVDNVFVTFKPNQTNMALMVGLDSNPSQDASYGNIDYCWYVHNDAKLTMFESGTEISSISGHTTYVAGDELRVEYSGGYIRYYHNGVVCREVARAISGKLYMDSSFHGASSCIYDVSYGPCARNAQYAVSAGTASSASAVAWGNVTGKPSTFTPSAHTHPVSDLTWGGGVNLTTTATANNQEWSIDLTPGSYTGTYWHVWSGKNSKTIFACYPDDNSVQIPNGTLLLQNAQGANTACMTIKSTATIAANTFQWGINHLVPNMSANGNTAIITGVANSSKNAGALQFHYAGSSSDSNCVELGLYGADHLFSVYGNGDAKLNKGTLHLFPDTGNYTEGIRIHATSNWSDILLCGSDNTGDSGTTANSWFIGNNNGNFYIMRNGSSSGTAGISCVSNAWKFIGNVTVPILGIEQTNGTSGGISLYAGTSYVDDYGICFRATSNKGKHGYVTSDWATYFTMSNTDNRGWVFRRNGVGNVASIDTNGQMILNGSLTLGGNETNTSGCRLVYNPIGSLDFVFV